MISFYAVYTVRITICHNTITMQWTTLTCYFHERSPRLKSCDIVNITSCVYDIGFSSLCFCAVQNNIIIVQYMTHFRLLLRNISLVGLAMKRQYMSIGILTIISVTFFGSANFL